MRRKILLLLFIVVVFIVAIPVAAYIGFPWYIKPLANRILGDTGAKITRIQVDRPNWNSIVVREVTLEQTDTASLSFTNADINFFDFFSRFKAAVEHVDVVIHKAEHDSPRDSGLLSEYLPENYLPFIPLLDISVETANIMQSESNGDNSPLLAQLLQINIVKNADQFRLNGTLAGQENTLLALSVSRDNAFRFALGKRANRPPLLLIESNITYNEPTIALQSSLTVDITEPLELKTELDKVVTGFTGKMESKLDLLLEDMPLSEFLEHPILNARGTLASDMKNDAEEINLAAGMTVEINLARTEWNVNFSPLPVRPLEAFSLQFNQGGLRHLITAMLPEPVTLHGQIGSLSKQNLAAANEAAVMFGYTIDNNAIAEMGISRFGWNGLSVGNEQFKASMHISGQADGEKLFELTQIDNVQLHNSRLNFSAMLEIDRDVVNVDIQEKTSFAAGRIANKQFTFNDARVDFPPQQLSVSRDETVIEKIAFNLQAGSLTTDSHQLSPVNASGTFRLAGSHATLTLATGDSRLRKKPKGKAYRLPPYRAKVDLYSQTEQAGHQLETAAFRLLNQCDVKLLTGNWRADRGLHINMEHDFSKQHSLKRWLNLKDLTADITQGKFRATIDWPTGRKDAMPKLNINLENADISGSLGIMENVQLSLSTLQAKSDGKYKLAASADSVNVGAEVENVVLDAVLTAGESGLGAHILQAHGDVFGGRALVENQHWASGKDSTIVIRLYSLNLAQLVQTQNIDSVTTNGELTGVLPVKLNKDGSFALAAGKLGDADGGVIRYQSSLSGSEGLNQKLQLTLDVLKNFKYETFNTQVEYNDGNLALKSNILGSNPEVAGGQQIDLNLNTEVNLKSAFQAMRLQAGLQAQVESLFSNGADSDVPLCQQPL